MFTELGFIECTFLKLVIAERKWLKAPSCTASNWSLQTRCTDFYRSLSLGAFCESKLLLMPLGEKAGIYRCLKKEVNHIKWLSWNKSRKWESDNIKHLLAFQLNQVTRRAPAPANDKHITLPSFNQQKRGGKSCFCVLKILFLHPLGI